jgi:hypothetical protein
MPDARIRAIYFPPARPAGNRSVYLYDAYGGYENGVLTWRDCTACRHGYITKISMGVNWQRMGIGRLLVRHAVRDASRYTWATSGQSEDGRPFFAALAAQTGVAFTDKGSACSHMKDRLGGELPRHRRARVLARLSLDCTAAITAARPDGSAP